MIPEMVDHGYDKKFSAALTAAAGTIGVIIPPSIPFVIYGVVSGTICYRFIYGRISSRNYDGTCIDHCMLIWSQKRMDTEEKGKRSTLKEIGKSFKEMRYGRFYLRLLSWEEFIQDCSLPTEAAVVFCCIFPLS